MKWKKLIAVLLCAMLAAQLPSAAAFASEDPDNGAQEAVGNGTSEEGSGESEGREASEGEESAGERAAGGEGASEGRGASGGSESAAEDDPAIAEILAQASEKFSQFLFEDPDTGLTLEYSLYIPEDYSVEQSYPLLMFIPDSTGSGKSAAELVSQYYGAAVWASDRDQQAHACFVLVPAFSETVVDDNWNTSAQIDTAVRLLSYLTETYPIDTDRLYTTGQSMGCMTSLYLNSLYPDLFAASMFVSGQWDITVLSPLEEATFFYITAGGDAKASGGQDEVMAMFDEDGIPYSYGTWNAQEDAETQDRYVEALLANGTNANMVRFETGSVLNGGSGMEHMASFNYGYKLTAVRDWLFTQSK